MRKLLISLTKPVVSFRDVANEPLHYLKSLTCHLPPSNFTYVSTSVYIWDSIVRDISANFREVLYLYTNSIYA